MKFEGERCVFVRVSKILIKTKENVLLSLEGN